MTDIKFKFKKTEEFIAQTQRSEKEEIIHSKIFEVFTHFEKPENIETLLNDDIVFLNSLETFKPLNHRIKVKNITLITEHHGRFSINNPPYNYDYICNVYSETFIVVGQDFKPIDDKVIRTSCHIEGQQEIFILDVDLDLAAYNNIVMERF